MARLSSLRSYFLHVTPFLGISNAHFSLFPISLDVYDALGSRVA